MKSGENSGKSDGMGIKNKVNILWTRYRYSDKNFRLRFTLFLILNKRKGGGNFRYRTRIVFENGTYIKDGNYVFCHFYCKNKIEKSRDRKILPSEFDVI